LRKVGVHEEEQTRLSLSSLSLHTFRGRMLLAGTLTGPAAGLVRLCGGREGGCCVRRGGPRMRVREQRQTAAAA
jgi:hypothetical protein